MRVTRNQIVNGLVAYIQQEIMPKMDDDRALKILFSVAVNAIKANDKLIDKYLSNDIVRALIDDDGSGNYDVERLMDWIIRPIAESYEKQKRFITDAGHEIKTPLTVINANVDLLECDYGENESLDDIRGQTKRLTALTEKLVYLAKMEENETALVKEDFSLPWLIKT